VDQLTVEEEAEQELQLLHHVEEQVQQVVFQVVQYFIQVEEQEDLLHQVEEQVEQVVEDQQDHLQKQQVQQILEEVDLVEFGVVLEQEQPAVRESLS
jgi:hypothetical protein